MSQQQQQQQQQGEEIMDESYNLDNHDGSNHQDSCANNDGASGEINGGSSLIRQDTGDVALFWQQHFGNESQQELLLNDDDSEDEQEGTSSSIRRAASHHQEEEDDGHGHCPRHRRGPCDQQQEQDTTSFTPVTVDLLLQEKMDEAHRRSTISTTGTGRLTPARLSDPPLSGHSSFSGSNGGFSSWQQQQPNPTSTPARTGSSSLNNTRRARSRTPTFARSRTPTTSACASSSTRRDRRQTARSSSLSSSAAASAVARSNNTAAVPVARRRPPSLGRNAAARRGTVATACARSSSITRSRHEQDNDITLQKTPTSSFSTSRRRTARQIQRRSSLGASSVEEEVQRRNTSLSRRPATVGSYLATAPNTPTSTGARTRNARYYPRRANSLGPNGMRRLRDAYLSTTTTTTTRRQNEEDEGDREQQDVQEQQQMTPPPQLEDHLYHMMMSSSQDLEKQQEYQNSMMMATDGGAGAGYRSNHSSFSSNLNHHDIDQTPGAFSVPGMDASSSRDSNNGDRRIDDSVSGRNCVDMIMMDASDTNDHDTLTTTLTGSNPSLGFTGSNPSLGGGFMQDDEHDDDEQRSYPQSQLQSQPSSSRHRAMMIPVADRGMSPTPPMERATRRRPPSPVLAVATAILVESDSEDDNSTTHNGRTQSERNSLARKQLELAEREEQLARQAAKLKAWEEQLERQRVSLMEQQQQQQQAQVVAAGQQQQTQTQSQIAGPTTVVQASQVINLSSASSLPAQPPPVLVARSSSATTPQTRVITPTNTSATATNTTTSTSSSSTTTSRRSRMIRDLFRSGRGEMVITGRASTEEEEPEGLTNITTSAGTQSLDIADLANLTAQIAAGNGGGPTTCNSSNTNTTNNINNNSSGTGTGTGGSSFILTGNSNHAGHNNSGTSITTAVVSRVTNDPLPHDYDYQIQAPIQTQASRTSATEIPTATPGVVVDENLDLALARAELGDGPLRFAPPTTYNLEEVLSRLSSGDQKAYKSLKERWENRRAKQLTKYGGSRSSKTSKKKILDLPLQWHLRYLHLCAKENKKDNSYYFSVEKAWNSERKVQRRFLSLNIYKMEEQILSKTLFPVPGLKTSGGHDMFYMRPSRYFPNRTSVKAVIDNQQYVMDVMLQNNEFAQKEGIGFIACMDDWKMKNFDVNYCFQFMMGLQGFMCPVKTQLFLIVNPPSWFGAIWKIMKPMLAPSFRKRVKIVPERKIAKYLAPGYQQYLPDDMQTGMADTDFMVADFIAYRHFVERDSILYDHDERPGSDAGHSIAPSSCGDDSHENIQVPQNMDYNSIHSMRRMTLSLQSSRSPSVSSGGMSLSGSGSGGSLGLDDDDDGASIHCDINDDELLEDEDMKQAATPEGNDQMYFDPAMYYG